MENADPAVKELMKISYDEKQPIKIRFKALLALADRAGLSPRQAMEIEVGPTKPFEQVLESMVKMSVGGSPSESRRARGVEDDTQSALVDYQRELPAAIDAEVVLDDPNDDDLEADLPRPA
jgi:hypothetical protein